MAKLSILLIYFFAISSVHAQIPKKASQIIIANNLSKADNFRASLSTLKDHGYAISKSDTASGIILTEAKPRSIDSKLLVHRLMFIMKDDEIRVTGENMIYLVNHRGEVHGPEWRELANKGLSSAIRTFRWMDQVCSSLLGCKVYQ